MMMSLLDASQCLVMVLLFVLLPGARQRSLNDDQIRRSKTDDHLDSRSISKEKKVEKFLDGQCPPSKWNQTRNTQNCTNECKNDGDCHNDHKCCTNGCSRACKEPWFPRRVVDWTNLPSLHKVLDGLDKLKERNRESTGEPCSTTVVDGLQPLRCPTNYVCIIKIHGDIQSNIPNRGECVTENNLEPSTEGKKEIKKTYIISNEANCSRKGKLYVHEEKFQSDCNTCVCHNGVVFCDDQPCPVKVGIPATADTNRKMSISQFINIDSDIGSGSTRSGEGQERALMDEVSDIEAGSTWSGEGQERLLKDEVSDIEAGSTWSGEGQEKALKDEFSGESQTIELDVERKPTSTESKNHVKEKINTDKSVMLNMDDNGSGQDDEDSSGSSGEHMNITPQENEERNVEDTIHLARPIHFTDQESSGESEETTSLQLPTSRVYLTLEKNYEILKKIHPTLARKHSPSSTEHSTSRATTHTNLTTFLASKKKPTTIKTTYLTTSVTDRSLSTGTRTLSSKIVNSRPSRPYQLTKILTTDDDSIHLEAGQTSESGEELGSNDEGSSSGSNVVKKTTKKWKEIGSTVDTFHLGGNSLKSREGWSTRNIYVVYDRKLKQVEDDFGLSKKEVSSREYHDTTDDEY